MLETGNAADRLAKLEARKANPNVDVVQITDFLALDASNKGLLQPIDYSKLKNIDQVYDFGRDPLRNREAVAYTVPETMVSAALWTAEGFSQHHLETFLGEIEG